MPTKQHQQQQKRKYHDTNNNRAFPQYVTASESCSSQGIPLRHGLHFFRFSSFISSVFAVQFFDPGASLTGTGMPGDLTAKASGRINSGANSA